MNINETFANNLSYLRKKKNITQAELADLLNYSDKAVSKWERGESIPDIFVLKQLSDLFEVSVDDLISEQNPNKIKHKRKVSILRMLICLASISIIGLVAMVLFSFIGIIIPDFKNTWLFFIYALVVTSLVMFILCSNWKLSLYKMLSLSAFFWFLILSIFLTILSYMVTAPVNLWMLFLIGVPLQVLLVFIYFYKRTRKK